MATDLLRDGEVQTAQGVLDAAGVTVPTGDLVGGVYDEGGEFYQLPEAVIADPENVVTDEGDGDGEERKGGLEADAEADGRDLNEEELERRREEKGKGVLKSGDLMRVKARLSDRGGPDVLVTLSKEQSVRVLVRKIQEEAGIPGKSKVRIAYLGKILKDGETLLAQGWREGHVVNALVFL
ncbi:hypothetical protein MMC19_000997 [Ptychographa xylographoides]|nr:hypothetical protein [Ptychographa xylographoides]